MKWKRFFSCRSILGFVSRQCMPITKSGWYWLLIFALHAIPSRAELYPENLAFQHILENKDIAIGTVFETFQDSEGFIWFGSENAFVRYDGYTLKPIYLYEGSGANAERKIVAALDIIEDRGGTIWVASSEGLLYYDRQRDQLVRGPDHPSLSTAPLSQTYLRALVDLDNGKFAIATYSGLYIVNPTTGEGDFYQTSTPNAVQHNSIRNINFDGDNALWIGTAFGLDRMNLDTGTIDHFKPFAADPESIPHNCVTSIIRDAEGLLWLGTRRGIIHFNPTTTAYTHYLNDSNDPVNPAGGDVWTMFEGANGYYWIGTEEGLIQFDPKSKNLVKFRHEADRASSLSSNVIRDVFKDKDSNIWVSTFPAGVNYIDHSTASIATYTKAANDKNSLNHNSVLAIAEDPIGNLWLGTDGGGLDYFDRKNNTFTHYLHDKNDPNTISSNKILSLMLDSRNTLWGGTWNGGVFLIELENNKISRLPGYKEAQPTPGVSHSTYLNNDKVWTIIEDKHGYIWIGTIRGGLSRYNRDSGEFTHYLHSDKDPTSIPGDHVWTIFEDSTGTLWVGTSSGLGILDRDADTFSNFIYTPNSPNSISHWSAMAVFEDSRKRVWIGTNSGLNLYNREAHSFKTYGLKDGFFDDSIRSITEDRYGRLWLGTNGGVTFFDPDTLRVKNYNREGGKLIGGFNHNSAVTTKAGETVLGGQNGLRIFQTDQIQFNPVLDDVVITDFKIFNEPVIYGIPGSPLQQPITQTRDITLRSSDGFFSFEFSTLNYSSAEKNQYAYMLEGFDSKWNNVGFRRTATYTNLDSGQYVFKVKAANGDGVWNDQPTSININILPPWWKTWWAYCLYSLVAVAVYSHYRRNRALTRIIEEKNRNLAIKRKLSQRITKILEDERKIIAQEVHDNINSTIIATRMITQSIERLIQLKEVNTNRILQLAQKADQQLSETYDFLRSLLLKLRPEIIETLGFDGAMQELIEKYNSISSSCQFELVIIGEKTKMSEDIGIGMYRIAQEAITNAIKHASATRVTITLNYQTDGLTMAIADNGCGFSLDARPGLGIEHMRERVQTLSGHLAVDWQRNDQTTGTTVTAYVPLV